MRRPIRSLLRRVLATVAAALTVCLGISLPSAVAETTTYEFYGQWQSPPTSVSSGTDALSAVWYLDINDDSPAPSNDPVPNNTVVFTATNAKFTAIPSVCKTSGVTPVSTLSADGTTLTCNIGTRDQGTAQVTFTGLVPMGNSGDQVGLTGEFNGKTFDLPKIPIDNKFVMDAKFDGGSTSTQVGALQELTFGWSLSHSTGSLPGPTSVSYVLTVNASNGETITLPTGSCSPISTGLAGFPYSDGAHSTSNSTDFPGCTLVSQGGGKYLLTLTGLNYDAPFPTTDSRGNALPTGMDVIASGQVKFRFPYVSPGTFTLSASTPTYTAAGNPSVTSVDSAANNSNSQAYTRGVWSHGFNAVGALSQGSVWTDTYRTYAGATVTSGASVRAEVGNSACVILDTKYVDFQSAKVSSSASGEAFTGGTIWYYTGTGGGLLDPTSTSYNPNAWTGCETVTPAAGWSTTPPVNLSTVKAVKYTQTLALINQGTSVNGLQGIYVDQKIKSTVSTGQDIWSWGSYQLNGTWNHPNRSLNVTDKPNSGTATPGARYPYAAAGRDVLRIIGSTPVVEKEVLQKEAGPGATVDYAVRYGLTADAGATGAVGTVVVTDTLPAGMTFVTGSSTPAPVVSGSPATGQTLTWTISNVSVNKSPLDVLNFKATVPSTATPGSTITNKVSASSQGQSATAEASLVVPKDGYTTLKKTAAQASVPTNNGVAKNSWTIEMESFDPTTSAKTDVVDILPYVGDGRGTDFDGAYTLDGPVVAPAGATVYYTTAAPATLKEDPKDPSNGGFSTTTGNTVGWTTTYSANATAIRVIGPALAYGQKQSFQVKITTTGSKGDNKFVNLAVGRATDTQLRMRTSASFTVTPNPAFTLKKYVRDLQGNWHDAQDASDYPAFMIDQSARYRIVVANTGNVDFAHLPLSDDKADLGQLYVDGQLTSSLPLEGDAQGVRLASLKVGETATIEYDLALADIAEEGDTVVNTACVEPEAGETKPAKVCDPAGVKILSSLAWNKIGPHADTGYLKGSEWAVVEVTGDGGSPVAGATETAVQDCTAAGCTGPDVDPRAGRFHLVGLKTGAWYRVTETKAPAGYVLADAPFYVYVDGTTVLGAAGIKNELAEVPELPLTGGTGSLSFWTVGAVSGLAVVAGLLWQRRRNASA
ncbi:SpaA isopeptide-forming pilin-related protein [Galactobacter sp.]|uniref:SpaA isopeptide-forming pilin-related protein n=1 Tax=Galactobacter sp. TaxID=2676125 RepID=UPI0025BEE0CD|nr:SpaA isopeptide-forming pilin-related protein [Galactobacter sp.]